MIRANQFVVNMKNKCSKCDQIQYSLMDKNYLDLFRQCWSCDKDEWEAGTLSLEEFEAREKRANKLNN